LATWISSTASSSFDAKSTNAQVNPGANAAPATIVAPFSFAESSSFNNPTTSLTLFDVDITEIPFLIARCAVCK
tara:strand:- start:16 stop:237 length:222 start_codon:yes stop_codon:yes gene_type:complete